MPEPSTEPPRRWREALQATLPVGLGYLPAGFAFGVLAVEAGLPIWVAAAMSLIVYAGALQYAAIPMMAGGVGLATFALTTLAINLRHLLYAIPLIPSLPRHWLAKLYTLGALTDETYALATTMPAARRRKLLFPMSLINQGWWIAGTLIGAVAGGAIGRHVPNLDFALPCLFLILAIEQYLAARLWLPVAVGVIAFIAARWLAPGPHMLIAALGAALAWLAAQAYLDHRKKSA